MPTVGNLNASLTANDNGFSAILKSGANNTDKLGEAFKKNTSHTVNFNAKMLESRKAIGLFSNVIGTSTGSLMHYIHAFHLAGPAIGGAIASLLAYKELQSNAEEEQNSYKKSIDEFYASMKKLRDFGKPENPYAKIDADIEEAGKKLKEHTDKIKEMKSVYGLLGGAMETIWYKSSDVWMNRFKDEQTMVRQARAELERLREMRSKGVTGAQHNAEGSHTHTESLVRTAELGVFKLEHSPLAANNPMLIESKQQTALQRQIAFNLANQGRETPESKAIAKRIEDGFKDPGKSLMAKHEPFNQINETFENIRKNTAINPNGDTFAKTDHSVIFLEKIHGVLTQMSTQTPAGAY